MKVLHITFSDFYGAGGTSIFVQNLQRSLIKNGVGSKILCRRKDLPGPGSIFFSPVRILDKVLRKGLSSLGLNNIHSLKSFFLPQKKFFREADLLHLHGIHFDFFNYLALPYLTRFKPAVWTFHDVWAFTGHCSANYDCSRWKTGCGQCPYPEVFPAIRRDATAVEWKLKKWAFGHSRLSVVSCSQWMLEMMKESLCKNIPARLIPNGVDVDVFSPVRKEIARQALGISRHKKVLMTASANLGEYRKGGDLLVKALQGFPKALKNNLVLLSMGNEGSFTVPELGIERVSLGYVTDNKLKALCYSAADLFVLPTRFDNAPLVLMESMACGTPTVSFRVGGMPEIIEEGVTGYTARPEDTEDLSRLMFNVLEDPPLSQRLGFEARARAVRDYSFDLVGQRYEALYKRVLAS